MGKLGKLDWAGLDWAGLDWIVGLGCTRFDWDWAGLDCTGLNWTGLG